jgi:16S rRNA (cytosine967-C5)-methyltransferase
VAELVVKQAAILKSAARLVRPGGRLVYATCSLLPGENRDIVSAFLDAHPQFRPLDCGELLRRQDIPLECGAQLQLWTHLHGTDGFFAAALERASG